MKAQLLIPAQNKKDQFFRKIGLGYIFCILEKLGFTPNLITAIGKIFGLLSFYYLFEDPLYFTLFYVAHLIMDVIDGSYARSVGKVTKFGKNFDHLGDLAVHSLLLLKSIYFLPESYLATFALITYLGEYLILHKLKLDEKRFPITLFVFFYIFGFYKFGLAAQIGFQLVSLHAFLYMNRKGQEKS